MDKVDYMKLAEQYANFLVAVGGVSITALTLVLSLRRKSKDTLRPAAGVARAFLVAALSVSTACCFIGAQMMAETAAYISYSQGKHPKHSTKAFIGFSQKKHHLPQEENLEHWGERLFLLASTNIFMAAVLVFFALMLLPTVSGEKQAANLAVISFLVFALIVLGALFWMVRAAIDRMPAPGGWPFVIFPMFFSIAGAILFFLKSEKSLKYSLTTTFVPIIISAVVSLLWFASIFGQGGRAQDQEIFFFSLAVTFSYTALIIAGLQIMHDHKAEADKRRRIKAAATGWLTF
jgi:hypothetical protein